MYFAVLLVLVICVEIIRPLLHLRRLAAETDEALKEQDERLGKILGKLQVSLLVILTVIFSFLSKNTNI